MDMTTKDTKPGCIGDCRVSGPDQSQHGESLDVQDKVCRNIARDRDWEMLFVSRESHSGQKGLRPKFEENLEYIKSNPGKVKYYIFRSIDRFTRTGVYGYEGMKRELAKYGVEMIDSYGIIQPPINTLKDLGFEYHWSKVYPSEINEHITAFRAKQEATDILTRTISQEIRLTQDGYQTGVPNDGYLNERIYVGNKKRAIQVPDPVRSKFYIRMFELRALNVLSDLEIVNTLNNEGFRTKVCNRWDKGKENIIGKRGGIPLTVKQLQKIIKNPAYCGIICEVWTRNLPIKAKWKGLVTIDLFNRANNGRVFVKEITDELVEILIDCNPNRTKKRNKDNPLFPYKFILCPTCKKPMVGSSPSGKSKKGFPTYHCARNHKYLGINKLKFESDIKTFFGNLKFCPEYLESLNATLINKYREKQKEVATSSSDISSHIADLETEMATKVSGITMVKNPSIVAQIEQQIEALEQQIKTARNTRSKIEITEDDIADFIRQAKYLIEHPGEIVMAQEDSHVRQGLANLYFEEMPTYTEIVNGTPKLHWIFESSKPNGDSKSHLAASRGIEPRYYP